MEMYHYTFQGLIFKKELKSKLKKLIFKVETIYQNI